MVRLQRLVAPKRSNKKTKAALFLELAQPDSEGFSRPVPVSEFVGKYDGLQMGNGGSWCRDDGGLARKFNIRRNKQKGAIVSVQLQGHKKAPILKPIPAHIKKQVGEQQCAVLGIGANIEVDHKDGRRDDPRLTDAALVTLDDFQPMSKAVNNAKRNHCKACRDSGNRFDAKQLGYAVSQVKGNGKYNGTCVGCYWHDPRRFNAEVSAGYGDSNA